MQTNNAYEYWLQNSSFTANPSDELDNHMIRVPCLSETE